jgi:hypothetical protein
MPYFKKIIIFLELCLIIEIQFLYNRYKINRIILFENVSFNFCFLINLTIQFTFVKK